MESVKEFYIAVIRKCFISKYWFLILQIYIYIYILWLKPFVGIKGLYWSTLWNLSLWTSTDTTWIFNYHHFFKITSFDVLHLKSSFKSGLSKSPNYTYTSWNDRSQENFRYNALTQSDILLLSVHYTSATSNVKLL